MDVNEHPRDEPSELLAQIRQAKLEWEATVDALPQVVCLLDTRGYVLRANRSVERWGYGPVHAVKGRDLHALVHPECADPDCTFSRFWRGAWEQVLKGHPAQAEVYDARSQRYLSVQIHPLSLNRREEYRNDGSFAAVIVHDVTERKHAEDMLEALSQRMLEVQEAERRYIARQLHDEIGQELTAVKINLQTVQKVCRPPSPHLDESIAIVERALQQVRDLSLELRPSMLDDLGLIPALRWYVSRTAQRSGFEADVIADMPEVRLPPEIETTCFRITQAALTNVVRHARATRVQVWLEAIDGNLELTIQDNGVGFDVAAARKRATRGGSLGLLSMEEQVTLAGGQIEIKSTVGHGARVRVRFPGMLEKP